MAANTNNDCASRFYRWGKPGDSRRNYDCTPSHPSRKGVHGGALLLAGHGGRRALQYDKAIQIVEEIFRERSKRISPRPLWGNETERLRSEFADLADKWIRETRHISLISKKITHPAYFRIVGMGKPVIPLLLAALRDRPSHWFAALRATANVDPAPSVGNASQSRQAWLEWGRSHGYIE
jgi:hypothetical protein